MTPNVVIEKMDDGSMRIVDRNHNEVLAHTEPIKAKRERTTAANQLHKLTGWPVIDEDPNSFPNEA